jgi:hypothetical protein
MCQVQHIWTWAAGKADDAVTLKNSKPAKRHLKGAS